MAAMIVLSEQLNHLEAALQITDVQLAQVVGTDPRTVQRWRANETFPQRESRRQLDALANLVQRLSESFKTPEGIILWLNSETGYFGGLRPADALLCGRIDAVDAALEALDSGVFV